MIYLMEIGILEYHYHWEFVETLKKICSNHNVIVFKDPKTAKMNTEQLDLLFVNTIKPLPWDMCRWFNFKPKCKTILTIHEANTDFKTMKSIFKKFDAINIPYLPMKDYVLKDKNYKGKLFTLPYAVHEKKYPNKNDMYVIPGKIEKFRRDYDFVFNMIDNHPREQKWCFLGNPMGTYGHQVMLKCIDYLDRKYKIEFYPGYVPQKEYNKILKDCKAIISPIKNPTVGTSRLFKEIYGKTKACGAIFESIKYGKELICTEKIEHNYKDYLLKDWKKYFKEVVLEELN